MARSRRDRLVPVLIESLVLATIAIPVLAFGGKSEPFYSLTVLLGLALLAIVGVQRWRHGAARPVTRRQLVYVEPWPALLLLAAFGVIHVAQLVPLPAGVVRVLAGWRPDGAWHALTPNPEATWRALLGWAPAVAVFAAVTIGYDTRGQLRRLLLFLFAVATAISLVGMAETVGGAEMIWNLPKLAYRGFVTGTFVNRNNYAAFVSLGLAAGFALALYRRARLTGTPGDEGGVERIVLLAFMGVICLAGVLLSQSRGGVASLLFAALPVIWYLGGNRQRRAFAIFVAAMAIAGVAMAWWIGHEPIGGRFAELPTDVRTADARPAAWWIGVRAWWHAPLFGGGAGAFEDLFRVVPRADILARYNHAHCDFLENAVETGLLGLLAFGGAIAWTIRRTVRTLGTRQSRFARTLTVGLTAGVAAVLFHSLFDFPLFNPGVRIPFFAVLGAAYVAANRRMTR